jgi:hypothetical protein
MNADKSRRKIIFELTDLQTQVINSLIRGTDIIKGHMTPYKHVGRKDFGHS